MGIGGGSPPSGDVRLLDSPSAPFRLVPLGGGGGGENGFAEVGNPSADGGEVSIAAIGAAIARSDVGEVKLLDCTLLAGGGGGLLLAEFDLLRLPAAIDDGDKVLRLFESILDSGGDGGSGFISTDGEGTFFGL